METTFTLEYAISLGAALLAAYIMQLGSPGTPPIIKFLIIPFLVAYLTLTVINTLFPRLNIWAQNVQNYWDNRFLGQVNQSNYVQIFPPILVVFVLALALLFLLPQGRV